MDYNKIESKPLNTEPKEEKLVEKEKVQKVVTGTVKKRKKNLIERLVIGIIGPDGLPAVGSYLLKEVIGPSLVQLTAESAKSAIDMLMYRGQPGHPGVTPVQPSRVAMRPQTNYANRYATPPQQVATQVNRSVRGHVVDYTIADRNEGYTVIQSLQAIAEAYNVVSLADYYDMIGVTSQYTDYNFGWDASAISQVALMPVAGGYVIKFPPLQNISK